MDKIKHVILETGVKLNNALYNLGWTGLIFGYIVLFLLYITS